MRDLHRILRAPKPLKAWCPLGIRYFRLVSVQPYSDAFVHINAYFTQICLLRHHIAYLGTILCTFSQYREDRCRASSIGARIKKNNTRSSSSSLKDLLDENKQAFKQTTHTRDSGELSTTQKPIFNPVISLPSWFIQL